MTSSDQGYMASVDAIASNSLDRSTKTGCLVIRPDGEVLASGFNSFPVGVEDKDERRERPEKYFWTEHAERNAIYSAAKRGVSLSGATAYVNWFPCIDCARALIQSGITRIVCKPVNLDHPKYAEDFKRASVMFEEAVVEVVFVGNPA